MDPFDTNKYNQKALNVSAQCLYNIKILYKYEKKVIKGSVSIRNMNDNDGNLV